MDRSKKLDLAKLAAAVAREQKRLQPLLPDIDPDDLHLILSYMLRPVEHRRYFHRRRGAGYVR